MSTRCFYTTPSWKKTALGTDIPLSASAELSFLRARKPLLLMGGIHGDEPEGVVLAGGVEKWLQEQALQRAPALVPWVVIPCLNVDGYQAGTRVNGRGVDLNRNYPSKDWSTECSQPRYSPGPSPGSEPEIQGVVQLLQELRPRLVIHCHSWQPCIVFTGEPARAAAGRLARASGYTLQDNIGYPTPGSLSRYGWHDHQIPVICIEERDQLKDLSVVWPRFRPAIEEIFTDLSERDV